MSLFSLERFPEAAKNFTAIGDLAMQDTRTAYAWAYSLVRTNQPQQANAIADILAARDLSPDVHLLVCKLYTASENYEHAIPCFRAIAAANPEMPGVHYELGATLIHLDKPADAIPELREELKTIRVTSMRNTIWRMHCRRRRTKKRPSPCCTLCSH